MDIQRIIRPDNRIEKRSVLGVTQRGLDDRLNARRVHLIKLRNPFEYPSFLQERYILQRQIYRFCQIIMAFERGRNAQVKQQLFPICSGLIIRADFKSSSFRFWFPYPKNKETRVKIAGYSRKN